MSQSNLVITTQPEEQAQHVIQMLSKAGVKVFDLPMIEIKLYEPNYTISRIIRSLESFNLLMFTSKNGVRGFFHSLKALQGNFSLHGKLKIAAIGKSTAMEVERYNHKADIINTGKTSDDFLVQLKRDVINSESKVLLVLGNLAPDKLYKSIDELCFVQRINVYETTRPKSINEATLALVKNQKADMMVFTSPSAFQNFIDITNIKPENQKMKIACIGQTTGNFIRSKGFNLNLVATKPEIDSFAEEIIQYLNH